MTVPDGVVIELDGQTGKGRIEVGGVDIASHVSMMEFTAEGGKAPTMVVLHIPLSRLVVAPGRTRVSLATRRALLALGWKGPDDGVE